MVKFNIFRNPNVDARVKMLLSSFDDGIRNQTEQYWRNTISQEIVDYATITGYDKLSIDQLSTIFKVANHVRKETN
jgi:hypothetical protein